VHPYPPGTVGGPCVILGRATLTRRWQVDLTVMVVVPQSSGVPVLEELEWATVQALASAPGGIGWSETAAQSVDQDAQLIITEFTATQRPT
jgi:hypothetical protein